jgi:hypothetical protein
MPSYQFDPDRCAEVVAQEVRLQKMALHFREALTERGLEGLASTARLDAVCDTMARKVAFEFAAMTLAGTDHPVYFEKTVSFQVPASWFDHLKEDLAAFLIDRLKLDRLGNWLSARARVVVETKRACETRYVPIRWCPHIPIRDGRGESEVYHIRWAGGLEE